MSWNPKQQEKMKAIHNNKSQEEHHNTLVQQNKIKGKKDG